MVRIEVMGGQRLPRDISRENWAGMMTNIQLFQPAIADICSALNLQQSSGPAAGYPGSSAVFVVDDRVVIKLYPPIFAADFAVELAVYERLNGQSEKIPALLAAGTYDHVFINEENWSWGLEAIIDWGDAEIGPPLYEWIAAWFGFCRMNAPMFRALVAAATPGQAFDDRFKRKLLACTFLHRFGPLIIRERWQAAPPPAELTISSLAAWLWPGIMD